jgi:hypothetical protein
MESLYLFMYMNIQFLLWGYPIGCLGFSDTFVTTRYHILCIFADFCCPFFQSIHDHDEDNMMMMMMMMMRGGGSGGGGGVVGIMLISSCCW